MNKKNYNTSFTVIMIVLMAYMFLNSFRYNRNIERLNTKIETLTKEVECYEALDQFNNRYQEELEAQLDSLNNRYQIFETPPARLNSATRPLWTPEAQSGISAKRASIPAASSSKRTAASRGSSPATKLSS